MLSIRSLPLIQLKPAEAALRKEGTASTGVLSTQAEALDERTVTRDISVFQVREQTLTTTDQGHQATAGVVIVLVHLEVFGQIQDALGEHRDLHLGRTGISFPGRVFLHDFLLDSGFKCHR